MTVASTLSKKQYQGNNLTTEFPLPFHVTAKEHIFAVRRKDFAITEIKNNFAVDLKRKVFIYPVQGEALKEGESITIYRRIPLTQIVDLENAGAFHPEVLEHDGFDRIVMQIQQLDEEINRAVKVDITDNRDTAYFVEELLKAREEAVKSAQKALEQAEFAADKADKAEDWALFAEDKVQELTDLKVECSISNDGQGQVSYNKEERILTIILPFDNAGSDQPRGILTDSLDIARSDIGASAKAVQSLNTKLQNDFIPKSAIYSGIDSQSKEKVASGKAVYDLKNRFFTVNGGVELSKTKVSNTEIQFKNIPSDGIINLQIPSDGETAANAGIELRLYNSAGSRIGYNRIYAGGGATIYAYGYSFFAQKGGYLTVVAPAGKIPYATCQLYPFLHQ